MKVILSIVIMLFATLNFSCKRNDLDILKSTSFSVVLGPLPLKILKYNAVGIQLKLVREQYIIGTEYKFRYKKIEGSGILRDQANNVMNPDQWYDLTDDLVVMKYTSFSDTEHILEFEVVDNSGEERLVRVKLLNDESSEQV